MNLVRYIFLAIFFLLAVPVFGQTASEGIQFTPEVPIPGVFEGNQTVDENFTAKYIRGLYIYFIWIVGVLATVMVVYGGVKWVTASGNPSRINDAREIINNAIIGVILALLSVVILNLISPQFTSLGLPDLPGAKQNAAYFPGAAVTGVCEFDASLVSQPATCGQIQKVGSYISTETGRSITRYCISAYCAPSLANPLLSGRVCSIGTRFDSVENATYLTPGGGCVDRIPVEPSSGQFANIASLRVNPTPLGINLGCGTLEQVFGGNDGYHVGSACGLLRDPVCYMIGPKGIIQDTLLLDTITNMRCARVTR